MSYKPTVAVDFDGVIHAYRRGWEDGVIYDDPVEGVKEALAKLAENYNVVVFTARDEVVPVWRWMRARHLHQYVIEVTNKKPKAKFYIDDRAIRFLNWEQTLAGLDELAAEEGVK